jgi:hypothetical protein
MRRDELGIYRVELEADYAAMVEIRAASQQDAMQRAAQATNPPLEIVEKARGDGIQSIRWGLGMVWPIAAVRVDTGDSL